MSSTLAVIGDVGASNGIWRATKPLRGFEAGRAGEDEHELIQNAFSVSETVTAKNYQEAYHDALQLKDLQSDTERVLAANFPKSRYLQQLQK